MVHEIENLFEKFRDIDKHFQLVPGADGHVLFIPRRNAAFVAGKALHKVNAETNFPEALKSSLVDFTTIGQYLKKSHNASDLATRSSQIVVDTVCCNFLGLSDDVGATIAGGYSAHKIEQMSKAIAKNETLASPIPSFKKFRKNKNKITLHLRGPKNRTNIGLAGKPEYPKVDDIFNGTNSTINLQGESLKINEISNCRRLFDFIIKNKNKISFVVIFGAILYVCFKHFSFFRKCYRKIKNISSYWIFKNRLTRGLVVIWRCTN